MYTYMNYKRNWNIYIMFICIFVCVCVCVYILPEKLESMYYVCMYVSFCIYIYMCILDIAKKFRS